MEKVLVAMSGGIDSSVAAYLLKSKDIEVKGVFFLLYEDAQKLDLVQKTAQFLDIKLQIEDVRDFFKHTVVEPFFEEYKKGNTPNPCVQCNKLVKFPLLEKVAAEVGANWFATGHYVRIIHENSPCLLRGIDPLKDQSYFLYAVSSKILKKALFPLGDFTKLEVKKLAEDLQIPSRLAEESAEVCFLKNKRYYDFIRNSEEGPIIEISTGKIIGKHRGIHLYTLGQRKRLGISYSYPLYVVKIEPLSNSIYVGTRQDAFRREFLVHELNWLWTTKEKEFECEVKIRYSMKPERAIVSIIEPTIAKVRFKEPQFAPTPGQSAVFYENDRLLGGGVIKELVQET